MATLLEMPRVMRTRDNFIRTFTGRKFWPLDPHADEIDVQDIAHSLSLQCRWTGHTYCHYSIAEHSLRVSLLAQQMAISAKPFGYSVPASERSKQIDFAREVALWGLLHDASEAYLCDLPSPLKHVPEFGGLYKSYERRLMECVAERFDLLPHMPTLVKDADKVLLNTEARDLMDVEDAHADEWRVSGERQAGTIYPLDPQQAEVFFMRRFDALTKARDAARIAAGTCDLCGHAWSEHKSHTSDPLLSNCPA
jgi:5'-deoxynucleotidase YfbR-like HD superfamily hydrolase